MRAQVLASTRSPLQLRDVRDPEVGAGELRIRIRACGVCRTDLHVVDGELPNPKLPLVLGHEIVGVVDAIGEGVEEFSLGDRVGVPWLGWTCGRCIYCTSGRENLCDRARFTGYTIDGGYAEATVADARFCFRLPDSLDDVHAAPLLCAGLIGHRCLRACGDAKRIGLYGFGAAAHIVAQVAKNEGREIYAFTRRGDRDAQELALRVGAKWAGDSESAPPELLDGAILFAPVGALVPTALRATVKGGVVVCGGIHMSDVPSFPYELLWGERVVRSIANLTRRDGLEFFDVARRVPIATEVVRFALADANDALSRLRDGRLVGAAVLTMDS
jgi:propanol-preferring alcohol dehydrogenase